MVNDKRRKTRFSSQARVRIPDFFKGEAFLKDISITGCGIESASPIPIKPGERFRMEVICEAASHIDNFDIEVESKWVRMGEDFCEAGFFIVASPTGKQFQNYVDYLSFRAQSK